MLLLANGPSHPNAEFLVSEECFFLPANTTSILHPMVQNVLQNIKTLYRRDLLFEEKSDETGNPHVSYINFTKSLSIKDAVLTVPKYWDEVYAKATIAKSR